MPTFGTVCDGIGCGHLAFNQVGFECAWSFEIEPFPSAVLAYRFPEVTNHGDMLKKLRGELGAKFDSAFRLRMLTARAETLEQLLEEWAQERVRLGV